MNARDLVALALMHKANGTLPGELSRDDAARFQDVMRTVNLWLSMHTEEEGALLMASAATDATRKAFYEGVCRVAKAGELIREQQDAGAWPPLTPEESAIVLAYLAHVPHHGRRVSADDVRALQPFAAERDAEESTHA